MILTFLNKSIRNYFDIPALNKDDIYEESRYILTSKLSSYITLALFLICIINLINYSPPKFIMTGVATVVCFISYSFIKKTGQYYYSSILSNLICSLLLVVSLYINPKNPHIVEGLWMINSSLFAFLTLGKKYGILFTIFHALNLEIFYMLNIENQIDYIYHHSLKTEEVIEVYISMIIAFLTFIQINWVAFSTNLLAARKIEVSSDILKEQFQTISKQNEEKTVMLKEIHHRVKNNLQLIISLLRLQSRELSNPDTIMQFEDAINRILTISLVHEKMYQAEDLSRLNLQEYFSSLGHDIIHNHIENDQIQLLLDFKIEKTKLKPIVPIAMIFNELLSNSLKHGKRVNEELVIHFSMKNTADDNLVFTYSDNGTWVETSNKNTFGLELIEALTQQIEGTMEIIREPSTSFVFIMKNPSSKVYVGQ
jgi:two-component sensor histidine kinase